MKATSCLAALCLLTCSNAAAVIPRQTTTKTPVSEELYQRLVYYGRYCSSYPEAPCQVPPENTEIIGFANSEPDTEMTLFKSDADREIVMAFPGTASLGDLLTDINFPRVPYNSPGINCPDCKVHNAVLKAWNGMAPLAKVQIDRAIAQYPDYAFVIAGHSLGGALAQFAFNAFAAQGYKIESVYSYGQFRLGNQAFADYCDSLSGASASAPGIYFRTTHADDGVPQVLPDSLGWRHPRNEYWFEPLKTKESTAANTFQCYGQEPTDCNNSKKPLGLLGINEAHIYYPGINVTGCGGFGGISLPPQGGQSLPPQGGQS